MGELANILLFLVCSIALSFVFVEDSRTKTIVIVGLLLPAVGFFLLAVGAAELYPKEWLDSAGFLINVSSGITTACFGIPIAYFVLQRMFRDEQEQQASRRLKERMLGNLRSSIENADLLLITRYGRGHRNTMRACRRVGGFLLLVEREKSWPRTISRSEYFTLHMALSGLLSSLRPADIFHFPPGLDPAWLELHRSWRLVERQLSEWDGGQPPVSASILNQVNTHMEGVQEQVTSLVSLPESHTVSALLRWLTDLSQGKTAADGPDVVVEHDDVDFLLVQEAEQLFKTTADNIMVQQSLLLSLQAVEKSLRRS